MKRSAIWGSSSPGGIDKKEHQEFASNIDLIDCLPPGLYEAVFQKKTPDAANVGLATGCL